MDELTYLINYLANKDNVREEILKLAREITRDCAMLIRKIHKSNNKDEFDDKLKDIAEKIEKITNFLNSLKEKKEAVSKEKVEEMLKLLDDVKDKLPKVNVDFEKIAKALEGTGSEVKIVFNKLTIDGEVGLKVVPLKKEKKD